MNNYYFYEYAHLLERILSTAYKYQYSLAMVEKEISYSPYFQALEKSQKDVIINEESLLKDIFKEDINSKEVPTYKECSWASEAYLYIQKETKLTFECIFLYIPINKMYDYFPLYHEMDFSVFLLEFSRLYILHSAFSILLKKNNYSLKYISELINVPYDTLVSYKQRKRDICKMNAGTAILLASSLHVRLETLLELKFNN